MRKYASPLVAISFACAGCLAAAGARRAETGRPSFSSLLCADGVVHRGTWSRLDEDGKLTLKADSFAVRHWLTLLGRDQMPLPAHPAGKQVVFANGDCLPLLDGQASLHIVGNRLHFHSSKSLLVKTGELAAPLPSIALVWLGGRDGAEEADGLLRKLVASRPKKDVVLLHSGEPPRRQWSWLLDSNGGLPDSDGPGGKPTFAGSSLPPSRSIATWWFSKLPS